MREHFPTLFFRAGLLGRHASHFYHSLIRMVEVGLLRVRKEPAWAGVQVEDFELASSSKNDGNISLTSEPPVSQQREASNTVFSRPEEPVSSAKEKINPAEAKLIISIHIPKTGGTTFLDVLQASTQEFLYLDYGKGINPSGVYRNGQRTNESFESIVDIDSLPGRSAIHGHFRAGKYREKFPRAAYVTWLRDPVERLASHYFFWQRTPFMDDPLCNRVITEKMTFEDFARLEIARNVQHRFLSPIGADGFAFVGITEEYERSLELFRRLISPNTTFAPKVQNTNPERQCGFYDLPSGVRERVLALNQLDASTYINGIRRFRQLCERVGI